MKLNYKRTVFIGFAFMSICAFWQAYDSVIPKILENTFGMGETKVGVIMALDNILALFLLPLFGTLSDRTKTPLGRRMPYILAGSAAAVVLMLLLPVADGAKSLGFFVTVLCALLLAMSLYRSPAVALMPDLTPKEQRSIANAVINFMGALGGVFTLVAIAVMKPTESGTNMPLFIALASFMAVCIAVLFLKVKERKIAAEVGVYDPDSEEKGGERLSRSNFISLAFLLAAVAFWFIAYNAVTSTFSRYTQNMWGDVTDKYSTYLLTATVAATLAYFPIAALSAKIGRKMTILCGIILMAGAFGACCFVRSVTASAYIMFAAVGIGWAAINVNSYPMVVGMSRGCDVGKYTGIYYTFSMAAQIITPVLSGFLIENTSFGYKLLFPYAFVFMVLAFAAMLFVKGGEEKS